MNVLESKIAPSGALTAADREQGALTDCFYMDFPRKVTLEEYVYGFYTTSLFRVERAILSVVIRKPSTDRDALLLSQNKTDSFSAWTVESREPDQILLRDYRGDTKSWLMVQPVTVDARPATRLYFGTVAVPKKVSKDGQKSVHFAFYLFGGFHRVYSRALLRSAFKRLSRDAVAI